MLVKMRWNDNFKPITPHKPCKLDSDFMAKFRSQFIWLEWLHSMKGKDAIILAIAFLGMDHLPYCAGRGAVDSCNIFLSFRITKNKSIFTAIFFQPLILGRIFLPLIQKLIFSGYNIHRKSRLMFTAARRHGLFDRFFPGLLIRHISFIHQISDIFFQ